MLTPKPILTRHELDLRLGIKSSLTKVKPTLALVFLIWRVKDKPNVVQYSTQIDNQTIEINQSLKNEIVNYLAPIFETEGIDTEEFNVCINSNLLFKGLREHLNVALELIWRIARIEFQNNSAGSERTGGVRFSKEIHYSTNMDIIDTLISSREEDFKKIFCNWLGFSQVVFSTDVETLLNKLLIALSESAMFKMADEHGSELIFNQEGIYKTILEFADEDPQRSVDLKGTSRELTGPLRIYNNIVKEDLHPYLTIDNTKVSIKDEMIDPLKKYMDRVSVYHSLYTRTIIREDFPLIEPINEREIKQYDLNRIVFGAPGTGKSNLLKNDCEELITTSNGGSYERVTFYPDYTYSNFVGTYKPITSETGTEILYKFIPGPYLRVYVAALKNPEKPHILLIEEINRAKVASVFGDMFQLLDRNDLGESEYAVHTSEDVKRFLTEELQEISDRFNEIKLPSNMFIWATMNSADQGVFPIDTAFKRRWSFEYLGINETDELVNVNVTLGKDQNEVEVNWNTLRKAINEKLLMECKVNEDKLMGPYFLSKNVFKADDDQKIIDQENFRKAFKNKVLMYLYEDAARQHRTKLFPGCDSSRYSTVCETFDEIGIHIFGPDMLALCTLDERPIGRE